MPGIPWYSRRRWLTACSAMAAPSLLAQPGLSYQKRPGRFEGVKAKPVSGFDIELLSFLVGSIESSDRLPELLHLRFHLAQENQPVHIVVRDLDGVLNYWLDRVEPQRAWQVGYGNEFVWPSGDVLRQLQGAEIAALGALVRLGQPHPSSLEQVAPALLFGATAPARALEYQVTVKTNGNARLQATVHRSGDARPVFDAKFPRQAGGVPLTIRWDASKAAAGPHTVVLRGVFLDTYREFTQSLNFHHEPLIR